MAIARSSVLRAGKPHQVMRKSPCARFSAALQPRERCQIVSTWSKAAAASCPASATSSSRTAGMNSSVWPSLSITGCGSRARIPAAECDDMGASSSERVQRRPDHARGARREPASGTLRRSTPGSRVGRGGRRGVMFQSLRGLAAFAAALLTATAVRGVELEPGDIVAMDARNDQKRLLRIDPETGARELIAARGNLEGGVGIALDAGDQILVAVSSFLAGFRNGVVQVDPATGASHFLSSEGLLRSPLGVAVESDGRIVVSDGTGAPTGRIVRV